MNSLLQSFVPKFRFYVLGIAAPTDYFEIPYGISHVGSSPGCALFIDDSAIELRHLQIRSSGIHGEICEAVNLSSSGRTLLDGEEMPLGYPLALNPARADLPGSTIRVGLHTLVYEAIPQLWTDAETGLVFQPENGTPQPPQSWDSIPAGLTQQSLRLLHFLPELYRTESESGYEASTPQTALTPSPSTFLSRFLALFESVLLPVEWQIDNFDFCLNPALAADSFLPWLEQWYGFEFDETWNVEQRRQMLEWAPKIFRQKGTIEGLECVLRIYTSNPMASVEIVNPAAGSFRVIAKINHVTAERLAKKQMGVHNLIEQFKPVLAHFDEARSSIA